MCFVAHRVVVGGGMLRRIWIDFALMVIGNIFIFQLLTSLTDSAKDRKISFSFFNVRLFHFSHQFETYLGYAFAFSAVGFVVNYVGFALFNYAYMREGLSNDSNLWFPQVMAWFVGPLTFTFLTLFQRGQSWDWRTGASLLLMFLAMLVRYWK